MQERVTLDLQMQPPGQVSRHRTSDKGNGRQPSHLASVSSREEFVDEESVMKIAIWAKACLSPGLISFLQQAGTQLGVVLHACTICKF